MLKFSEEYKEDIEKRNKKITIRKGDFSNINKSLQETDIGLKLRVYSVRVTSFKQLTKKELTDDNFLNKTDMYKQMKLFYPNIQPDDVCSVIRFKVPHHEVSHDSLQNLTPGNPGNSGNQSSLRGKPTLPIAKAKVSMNHYQSGFYSNKFKPCNKCDDFGGCPYAQLFPGRPNLHEPIFDEFGIQRCTKEIKHFNKIVKVLKEEFPLADTDLSSAENYAFLKMRLGRSMEYMANKGVTQKRTFMDKEGKPIEIEMPNMLQKGFYFDMKVVRDAEEALKISRQSREPQETKVDLSIEFTKDISLEQTEKQAIECAGKTFTKEIKKKIELKGKDSKS